LHLRMISLRSPVHKSRAAILGCALLVMAGCGGGAAEEKPATATGTGHGITMDAGGWTAFTELAERITTGQEVSREEMGGLGADPAWERWRANIEDPVDLRRMANWVEATFWTELGRTGTQKTHPVRQAYVRSWRWSWEHRDVVDARVAETAADVGNLAALMERWIAPEHRTRGIVVSILPTRPQFRFDEDEFFVDTGFLAAIPRQRLMPELVGLMYRDLEFIPGDDYRTSAGAAAVAHTFRALRNEGMAHWLEDTPHAYFLHEHPTFRDVNVIPEKFWEQALRAMEILNAELPAMWAEPDRLAAKGRLLMRALNTIQADRKLGYAMAAVIVGNLGEERLRAASGTVPGFIAAFQEAACRNAVPPPTLQEAVGAYHTTLPPFSDEAWSGLPDLLLEFFPE